MTTGLVTVCAWCEKHKEKIVAQEAEIHRLMAEVLRLQDEFRAYRDEARRVITRDGI